MYMIIKICFIFFTLHVFCTRNSTAEASVLIHTIEQEKAQAHTRAHKMRLASKVLYRRSDVYRIKSYETDAADGSREKSECDARFRPPIRPWDRSIEEIADWKKPITGPDRWSRGIHIQIYIRIYISYFTVHNTSLRNHRRTKDQKSDFFPFLSNASFFSFHSSIANRDWLALPMVPPLPPMFSVSPDEWEILYKTMCIRWFRWELRKRKKKRTTLLFCQISPSTWFRADQKSNHQQTIEV